MTARKVDAEKLLRLHRQGMTAPQIAAELKVDPRTVQRWRARLGVGQPVSPYVGKPVTPERLSAAEKLLADGASMNDVVATTHMSRHTLRNNFPNAGWTRSQAGIHARLIRTLNQIQPFQRTPE